MPPLHLAVSKNYEAIITYLIKQGANVNAEDKRGYRPLHLAALSGNLDIFQLLINNGAELNARSSSSFRLSAFDAAQDGEHHHIMEWIIQNGGVNSRQRNNLSQEQLDQGLMSGVRAGIWAHANAFFREGGDINARHNQDRQPMHQAAKKGKQEILEWLIQNGALVDSRSSKSLKFNFQFWSNNLKIKHFNKILNGNKSAADIVKDIIRFLVEIEFYSALAEMIRLKICKNWRPLHSAAIKGHRDMMDLLIKSGACINDNHAVGDDISNETILGDEDDISDEMLWEIVSSLCIMRGHVEVIEWLISNLPNIKNKIKRMFNKFIFIALHTEADNFEVEEQVVETFVNWGFDINTQLRIGPNSECDSATALILAASYGKIDVVKLLIRQGADRSIRDSLGGSARDAADFKGHKNIVALLP